MIEDEYSNSGADLDEESEEIYWCKGIEDVDGLKAKLVELSNDDFLEQFHPIVERWRAKERAARYRAFGKYKAKAKWIIKLLALEWIAAGASPWDSPQYADAVRLWSLGHRTPLMPCVASYRVEGLLTRMRRRALANEFYRDQLAVSLANHLDRQRARNEKVKLTRRRKGDVARKRKQRQRLAADPARADIEKAKDAERKRRARAATLLDPERHEIAKARDAERKRNARATINTL